MQIDYRKEAEKVAFLNELYVKDGRDNPHHPFHMLNTGLYQKYLEGKIGVHDWFAPVDEPGDVPVLNDLSDDQDAWESAYGPDSAF